MVRIRGAVLALLLFSTPAVGLDDKPKLTVTPQVMQPGDDAVIRVLVLPHKLNRALFILVNGPKSVERGIQLEGDDEHPEFLDERSLRALPKGTYVVLAVVRRVVDGEIQDIPSDPIHLQVGSEEDEP